MATSRTPQPKVVHLFSERDAPSGEAASRAKVVRSFAEATAALGRAAELMDDGPLESDTKLVLIRGVKELVIRTFNLNAAYMEAEASTFRLGPSLQPAKADPAERPGPTA
ncbi:MAG: hypothetical protein FD152_2192 [Xanthobacteraceae bacterium]|nr:MAG: hypothetical protein FD152_2192 [Xanthobacteraceae bacterium]